MPQSRPRSAARIGVALCLGLSIAGCSSEEPVKLNTALTNEYFDALNDHNIAGGYFDHCIKKNKITGGCYAEVGFLIETDAQGKTWHSVRLDKDDAEAAYEVARSITLQISDSNAKDSRVDMFWQYQPGLGHDIDRRYHGRSDQFDTHNNSGVYEDARQLIERMLQESEKLQ